jgi:hypothetical protein
VKAIYAGRCCQSLESGLVRGRIISSAPAAVGALSNNHNHLNQNNEMKTTIKILFVFGLLCRVGHAQGFVNLNFEAANIVPDPNSSYFPYGIATTNALPGWNANISGSYNQGLSDIIYDTFTLGSPGITILDTNAPDGGSSVIQGRYTMVLQATAGFNGYNAGGALSQTGLVPALARTLLFSAQLSPAQGTVQQSLQVSLGGQILNIFASSTGPNYSTFGADVSAFAGQTEPLTFADFSLLPIGVPNELFLDNIQFSSTAVPEPGTLALGALGIGLLALRRGRATAR